MTDWVEYEWSVRGDPALFVVNTAYADDKPEGTSTLIYCAAVPNEDSALYFDAKELRRLISVEKRLEKALPGACYAGFIHMDALRQFYFYVNDTDTALEAAEKLTNVERKLKLMFGTAEEPDWLTYHALLLPDAAKYQTIYNKQLIDRQKAAGDALEKVRRVSFFVCFASDQQRALFVEDARNAGFAIGDALFQAELALSHVQTLFALSSLDKRDIDELTTRAIRVAKNYGGEFLRWTCPKMSKKSPLS